LVRQTVRPTEQSERVGDGRPTHTDVVCGEEHSCLDEKLGGGVHTEPTYDDDVLGSRWQGGEMTLAAEENSLTRESQNKPPWG